VRVVYNERVAQPIGYHVRCYGQRDQGTRCRDIHARQRDDDLAASGHQTCAYEHIRCGAEEQIRSLRHFAVSCEYDIGKGVCASGALGLILMAVRAKRGICQVPMGR
jgi:hypothetical protein